MSGDQRNLNVHGAWARVMSPTTRMSTPLFFSQSGMAIQTSPSGSPEENDSSVTEAVRHDLIARRRLTQVPGRLARGAGAAERSGRRGSAGGIGGTGGF